jgi:uncharacterized protein (DUF2062 family)
MQEPIFVSFLIPAVILAIVFAVAVAGVAYLMIRAQRKRSS